MAKFRKKPVVIDAVRFDPSGPHKNKLPEGVIITKFSAGADNLNYVGFEFGIEALGGVVTVTPGDWIIKGVKGEFYPCKPDIFAMTYEPAS